MAGVAASNLSRTVGFDFVWTTESLPSVPSWDQASAGLAAIALPERRPAPVDPIVVLRHE